MTAAQQIPVSEGLFTWPPDELHLIGSRCSACGLLTFPQQRGCPRCGSDGMEELLLKKRGTLWGWTTQGFPPPGTGQAPEMFQPYGVGYVELPGELRVEARLTESDPKKLHNGMPMELVLVPLREDAEGNEVMTFAFRPVA